MNSKQRMVEGKKLYSEFERIAKAMADSASTTDITKLRAEATAREQQVALLRLLQSEDRLRQFLVKALIGVFGTGLGVALSWALAKYM